MADMTFRLSPACEKNREENRFPGYPSPRGWEKKQDMLPARYPFHNMWTKFVFSPGNYWTLRSHIPVYHFHNYSYPRDDEESFMSNGNHLFTTSKHFQSWASTGVLMTNGHHYLPVIFHTIFSMILLIDTPYGHIFHCLISSVYQTIISCCVNWGW